VLGIDDDDEEEDTRSREIWAKGVPAQRSLLPFLLSIIKSVTWLV